MCNTTQVFQKQVFQIQIFQIQVFQIQVFQIQVFQGFSVTCFPVDVVQAKGECQHNTGFSDTGFYRFFRYRFFRNGFFRYRFFRYRFFSYKFFRYRFFKYWFFRNRFFRYRIFRYRFFSYKFFRYMFFKYWFFRNRFFRYRFFFFLFIYVFFCAVHWIFSITFQNAKKKIARVSPRGPFPLWQCTFSSFLVISWFFSVFSSFVFFDQISKAKPQNPRYQIRHPKSPGTLTTPVILDPYSS